MKRMTVCLTALTMFGASLAIADNVVAGHWRFDDANNRAADSGGSGSDIVALNNGAEYKTESSPRGGYLHLPNAGSSTATATLKGNVPDLSSSTKGWTIATWIRGSSGVIKKTTAISLAIAFNQDAKAFYNAMTDGKWHPIVVVFDPNRDKSCYRIYVDAFDGEQVKEISSTEDTPGNNHWVFPVSVSGSTVTLGGRIAGSGSGYGEMAADFFGDLDDCLVLDRDMRECWQGSKGSEVFRWVSTGETYVYRTTLNDGWGEGWSNKESAQPGIDYMVDDGYILRIGTGEGGSNTFPGNSMTIGRTKVLKGITEVGGSADQIIVSNTKGTLNQVAKNTTYRFDRLILNDGKILSSASGQKFLNSNLIVNANEGGTPFEFEVADGAGFSLSGGTLTGDGVLAKTGAGTLNLSTLSTSSADVVLKAGTLRLADANPVLSGYEGGTILVGVDGTTGAARTVSVTSAWDGKLAFKIEGTLQKVCRLSALTVAKSVKTVSASDFQDLTAVASGWSKNVRVVESGDLQTVCLECVPTADVGGSPIVILE